MRRLLPFVVALVATSIPAFSQSAPAKQAPAATPGRYGKALEELRGDLQARRSDLMAKNISLSPGPPEGVLSSGSALVR